MAAPRQRLVIGAGNDERGDDGVGLWLVRRLEVQRLPGVMVRVFTGDPTRLLEIWANVEVVYLVDAISSGAPPGTVRRFNARCEPLPRAFFHLSSHGTSVADAVALGKALRRLPPRLVIYGIESKSFGVGQPISPEVRRGAEQALAALRRELEPSHA